MARPAGVAKSRGDGALSPERRSSRRHENSERLMMSFDGETGSPRGDPFYIGNSVVALISSITNDAETSEKDRLFVRRW